jgi:hypothetical protein
MQVSAFLRGIASQYPDIAHHRRIAPQATSIFGGALNELVISSDLPNALTPPESPTRPHVAMVAGVRCGLALVLHELAYLNFPSTH